MKSKFLMNGLYKLAFDCLILRVKRSNLFSVQRFLRLLRSIYPLNNNFMGFPSIIILLLVISLTTMSCEKKTAKITQGKMLKVVTTLFPLYDFAKNVGKQRADVTLLLPPGVEPHSFEPKPKDILTIHEADIFIYTGKFMEPWVKDVLKGVGDEGPLVVDSGKGIVFTNNNNEYRIDPHIWLDFSKAQKMVDNILEGFLKRDPENSSFYIENAKEFKKKLNKLDRKYKDSLSSCKKKVIIHGGHFAFGYLANRYNLKYISAYKGFAPDAEPTPGNLIELIKNLKNYNVKYLFYEELVSPKVAEVISKETGAKLLLLHGAHNVTREDLAQGVTFIFLMEQNLRNLMTGLECK
jgi:zinc transport system substrate-binding protein